jgi:uncharacterized protein YaaW (UPF0174 family)
MGYQLTDILSKATKDDIEFILSVLDSRVNFTDDSGLKAGLNNWGDGPAVPAAMAEKVETEIRYVASNEFAYLGRLISGAKPAGVQMEVLIADVASHLKIKNRRESDSVEDLLKDLALRVLQREISALSRDGKIDLINKASLDRETKEEMIDKVKSGASDLDLGTLLVNLSHEDLKIMLQGMLLSLIATIVGVKAGQKILGEIAKRMSGAIFGPIVAGLAGAATSIAIAGPAYRKTVPIALFLGTICLRDSLTNKDMQLLSKYINKS